MAMTLTTAVVLHGIFNHFVLAMTKKKKKDCVLLSRSWGSTTVQCLVFNDYTVGVYTDAGECTQMDLCYWKSALHLYILSNESINILLRMSGRIKRVFLNLQQHRIIIAFRSKN